MVSRGTLQKNKKYKISAEQNSRCCSRRLPLAPIHIVRALERTARLSGEAFALAFTALDALITLYARDKRRGDGPTLHHKLIEDSHRETQP